MKDIINELNYILNQGYSSYKIFNDWLDLMLYALMENHEEEYLKTVHRYRNTAEIGKREIDHFKNAFHLLMAKMQETNDEILGEIYMQWNVNNKYAGQFFTPKNIATFMTQIVNPTYGEIISDPCCGAGIMLIEACKLMNSESLDKALFIGQDLDKTGVKMCALNLLFFNLNGYIIHGNTIELEYLQVYQIIRSPFGGSIRKLTDEEVEIIRPKITHIVENQQDKQLNLFS